MNPSHNCLVPLVGLRSEDVSVGTCRDAMESPTRADLFVGQIKPVPVQVGAGTDGRRIVGALNRP